MTNLYLKDLKQHRLDDCNKKQMNYKEIIKKLTQLSNRKYIIEKKRAL